MRTVAVVYHCGNRSWWAESPEPDLHAFVAGSGGLEQTRAMVKEGLEFQLGEAVTVDEYFDSGGTLISLEIDAGSSVDSDVPTAGIICYRIVTGRVLRTA